MESEEASTSPKPVNNNNSNITKKDAAAAAAAAAPATNRKNARRIAMVIVPTMLYLYSILGTDVKSLNPVSTSTSASTSASTSTTTTTTTTSCIDYKYYPVPSDNSTGLPYLADVFATHDAKYVEFIGINRGACRKEYRVTDFFNDKESGGGYRFMCLFDGVVPVISEYVAPSATYSSFAKNNYVFRCLIPPQFRAQIVPGMQETTLHVDLHALHDLSQPYVGHKRDKSFRRFPSQVVTDTHKIPHIPICHPIMTIQTTQTQQTQTKQPPYNLVAYTRIKSEYNSNHYLGKQPAMSSSHTNRMIEWMAYHLLQGFDHFVIYDSDEAPNGPIHQVLLPYIASGLVTYRHWPLKDCVETSTLLRPLSQSAAGIAAMHRMMGRNNNGTNWFASFDVDEFMVVLEQNTTVAQLVQRMAQSATNNNERLDAISFNPLLIEYCKGVQVKDSLESPLAHRTCITDQAVSGPKLIMRPNQMLIFQTHSAVLTWDWTQPRIKSVSWQGGEGFLAHYRGDVQPTERHSSDTSRQGKKLEPWHHMDQFVPLLNTTEIRLPPAPPMPVPVLEQDLEATDANANANANSNSNDETKNSSGSGNGKG